MSTLDGDVYFGPLRKKPMTKAELRKRFGILLKPLAPDAKSSARFLEGLGINVAGLLHWELAAELEVRTYLVRKKLGDAAPKGAWRERLLRKHAPHEEDLPELIRNIPSALAAPSVRRLLSRLRSVHVGAEERLEALPGGPIFYRPAKTPKKKALQGAAGDPVDVREDETLAARTRLLTDIAKAFEEALAKPPPSRELEAELAVLEKIEARALEAPHGRVIKTRVELARAAGFKGTTDANVLAAFRQALRRARGGAE